MRRRLALPLAFAAAGAVTACAGGGGDAGGTGPGGAGPAVTQLVVQSGLGQSAEAETELMAPVVVRATNVIGAPVAGATVTVTASDGGHVVPASQPTGSDGTATFRWTLGAAVGLQQLRLRAGSAPELAVAAQATPAGLTLQLLTPPSLTGEYGQTLPDSLRVRLVRNRDNAPIAGATVTFAVASGGGTVSAASRVTDSDGRAAVRWTLGAGATQQVTASVAATSTTGGASQTLNATATPEARTLQVVGGNAQTGEYGQPLPDSLRVRLVRNRDNAPIAGATVTFAVASGGGTVSAASRVTDSDGRAAVRWTLGAGATQQVTASVAATSTTGGASQALTATAVPEARVLQVVGGNNQTGEFGQPLPDSVRVRLVRNRDNAPIAGATVTFAVASGGGTVSAASRVTDSDGRAAVRWTLGAAGTQQVTASVAATNTTGEASQTLTATAVPSATLGVGFGDAQFELIPAGSFQMGTPGGGPWGDEAPVRTVTLSAFRLQRTEVTQGQWRQVMAGTALANPSYFSSCGDTCPVESVSWDDIQQFLQRLNQQDSGKGYRLPTEAEWEYAARAGTTGDYGIAGSVCSFAWVYECGARAPRPVTQDPANAWGLRGMHGDVWEWVQDWYGTYPSTPQTNPTGPATGSYRVLRGGSWSYFAGLARSATRSAYAPSYRSDVIGFRLARTP